MKQQRSRSRIWKLAMAYTTALSMLACGDSLHDQEDSHPKLSHVMRDVLRAAEQQGEKTLIFCARIGTLTELSRKLKSAWEDRLVLRWQRAVPEATHEDIFDTREEDRRERGRHPAEAAADDHDLGVLRHAYSTLMPMRRIASP